MVDDYYEPTLGDHLRALRRLWPLVAATAAVGAILGLVVGAGSSDPTYASDAVISLVDERFVVASLDIKIADVATPSATAAMNRAMASDVVALANERAGVEIDVVGVPDESAGTFTFTVTADSPEAAVQQANTFSDAAVEVARTSRTEVLDQTAQALDGRMAELDVEIAALRSQVTGADAETAAALTAELEVVAQRRLEYGDRLAALASFSESTTGGLRQLSAAATAEETGGGLSRPVAVVGGGLLGALGGLGLVVVASLADRRIRTRADAELNSRGVPVLGVLSTNDTVDATPVGAAVAQSLDPAATALVLVPAGAEPIDPQVASEMSRALEQFGSSLEVTIGGTETVAFDDEAQRVLVVAHAGRTTDDELAARVTELSDIDARVVGLILTGVDPRDLPRAAAGLDTRRDNDDAN